MPFFRHWAPEPAPEPSPGLRLCRGIAAALPARKSRGAAPARAHAYARAGAHVSRCGAWHSRLCAHSAIKGSFNPTRLLEAAELLEADQRKHEGGQSKGTSSTFWIALRLLPCLVPACFDFVERPGEEGRRRRGRTRTRRSRRTRGRRRRRARRRSGGRRRR